MMTWETDGTFMYKSVKFICMDFGSHPTDAQALLLSRSPFMYGFFNGKACWHAMKTDDTLMAMEAIKNAR